MAIELETLNKPLSKKDAQRKLEMYHDPLLHWIIIRSIGQ